MKLHLYQAGKAWIISSFPRTDTLSEVHEGSEGRNGTEDRSGESIIQTRVEFY